jgi:hypothetical protein
MATETLRTDRVRNDKEAREGPPPLSIGTLKVLAELRRPTMSPSGTFPTSHSRSARSVHWVNAEVIQDCAEVRK